MSGDADMGWRDFLDAALVDALDSMHHEFGVEHWDLEELQRAVPELARRMLEYLDDLHD